MKRPRITYYPRIEDPEHFRSQLVRAAWYLAPVDPESITFFSSLPLSCIEHLEDFSPEAAKGLSKESNGICIHDESPSFDTLARYDIVICWTGLEALNGEFGRDAVQQLRKSGVSVFDVDHSKRTEGSRYIDISHRFPKNDAAVTDQSFSAFAALRARHHQKKSFIVCSGPEIKRYQSFDFSDGLGIVCNSVINDAELMAKVRPKVQIFGDPIFHFGCSRYAHQFRRKLLATYNEYQFSCIVPIKYYNLICHWLPELKDRLLAIPFHRDQDVNLSLESNFQLHTTDNILTFMMLPVACSLSDEIFLLGCDGRPLSQNDYFWKHNEKTQFVDEMDNIQIVHPSFFKLDYDEYYFRHCDNVERYFTAGEKLGKSFHALTPSHIPAIHQREHPLTGWDTAPAETFLVINTRGTDDRCRERLTVSPDDRIIWADSCANVEDKPFQVRVFNDGVSEQLALPNEFDDLVSQLDWLQEVFSIWGDPVVVVQPDATVASFQALSASTLSGRRALTVISSAEMNNAGVAFLKGFNGNVSPDNLFASEKGIQAEIYRTCGLRLPVWDPSEVISAVVSPPLAPSRPRTVDAPRKARDHAWQRAHLALKEQHLDLAFEFAVLQDSLAHITAAVEANRVDLKDLRSAMAEQTASLKLLQDSFIASQGAAGKHQSAIDQLKKTALESQQRTDNAVQRSTKMQAKLEVDLTSLGGQLKQTAAELQAELLSLSERFPDHD